MPRRSRYVPINERIADYCGDFIPEQRINGYVSSRGPLPEDADAIYEPFDNTERSFFEDGRRKFFAASEDPSSVFGKDFKGGKGGITETIETLPDGKVVKKRVVTTYEDVEPARPEPVQQSEKKREPMTPMEVMFATQQAMRNVFDSAKGTRKQVYATGMDVTRLAAQCGVDLEADNNEEDNEVGQATKDYSNAAPRDVKINVKRFR